MKLKSFKVQMYYSRKILDSKYSFWTENTKKHTINIQVNYYQDKSRCKSRTVSNHSVAGSAYQTNIS